MTGAPLRALKGGARLGVWGELWERDRWLQSELPNGDLSSTHRGERAVNFGRLEQPWLIEAAKRWARARLLAGTSVGSVASYLSDVAPFSEWLACQRPDVSGPGTLGREVLEDYMLVVRTEPLKGSTRVRLRRSHAPGTARDRKQQLSWLGNPQTLGDLKGGLTWERRPRPPVSRWPRRVV